jgi:hypothetical protein
MILNSGFSSFKQYNYISQRERCKSYQLRLLKIVIKWERLSPRKNGQCLQHLRLTGFTQLSRTREKDQGLSVEFKIITPSLLSL